jgi:hypothetical protein
MQDRLNGCSRVCIPRGVLPGTDFSSNLIETTGKYGISEVLGAQPLTAGVTSVKVLVRGENVTNSDVGPVTVLNNIMIQRESDPPNYLHFVGWFYLWGYILHWITAVYLSYPILLYSIVGLTF